MTTDVKQLKSELALAGIEVYRSRRTEIHIAERVRLHIMDSGVRLHIVETGAAADPPVSSPTGESLRVTFTARSQRSDFPNEQVDVLFERVRSSVGPEAVLRGFVEVIAQSLEVKDPMDDTRVLDVWHEITYGKPTDDTQAALDEIRWALALERCVQR